MRPVTFHCKLCGEPHDSYDFVPGTWTIRVPTTLVSDKDARGFFLRCESCPTYEPVEALAEPRWESELEAFQKWSAEHAQACRPEAQDTGRWGVRQTNGAGIGTITTVMCRSCKAREDVTDYGGW